MGGMVGDSLNACSSFMAPKDMVVAFEKKDKVVQETLDLIYYFSFKCLVAIKQ